MSVSARRFLLGVVLSLAAGGLIGWFYGNALAGVLVATLLVLIWQIRQLLSFERALRTDDFDRFRLGEGIWQQIIARVRFERDRAGRRKANHRRLLREIRKSTDAMPDGAIILDENHEIVSVNKAARQLTGVKRKKDRGQRVDNILRAPSVTAMLESPNTDKAVEIPSPVNEGHWLSCRVVPYGAEQKIMFLRDISDRKRLSKMRRDFVANASHELRSPLTVIAGYLDALAESGDLPADWEKPVSQMQNQATRMRQILSEMLELSRLESAATATREERVIVGSLLRKIASDYSIDATAAEIVVDLSSDADLLGHAGEIESVVTNLISNALRYTPADGSITVAWRNVPEGAELSVVDTGDGIEEEHISRLTERFFRVDRGRSRDEGGIGLGLAIVKHILLRHDAELIIESEPGVGSTFRCVFPKSRTADAE